METFGQALRRLRGGISIRALAKRSNCSPSYISALEFDKSTPSLRVAKAIDKALSADGALTLLANLASEQRVDLELVTFTAWIEQSNVGSSAISIFEETASLLAEKHTRTPPSQMLKEVNRLNSNIQTLLLAGKQRLRETRDLLRIEAGVLAHACILLGDLYDDDAAILHGITAALCAEEAGISVAAALSAQAKTERWRGRFRVSADTARRGFECSAPTPLRVLLACQEANAAGLLGDAERAREALQRAEKAAETVGTDSGLSPWSCPRPRQALFELSVALQIGEAKAAINAAEKADQAWTAGEPYVQATWAQIRFGAANAYVEMGDSSAAAEQIEMDGRLQDQRFHGSALAREIREQILEFNSTAAPRPIEDIN